MIQITAHDVQAPRPPCHQCSLVLRTPYRYIRLVCPVHRRPTRVIRVSPSRHVESTNGERSPPYPWNMELVLLHVLRFASVGASVTITRYLVPLHRTRGCQGLESSSFPVHLKIKTPARRPHMQMRPPIKKPAVKAIQPLVNRNFKNLAVRIRAQSRALAYKQTFIRRNRKQASSFGQNTS